MMQVFFTSVFVTTPDEDPSIMLERTERLLGDAGVRNTLQADPALFEAYRHALGEVFDQCR